MTRGRFDVAHCYTMSIYCVAKSHMFIPLYCIATRGRHVVSHHDPGSTYQETQGHPAGSQHDPGSICQGIRGHSVGSQYDPGSTWFRMTPGRYVGYNTTRGRSIFIVTRGRFRDVSRVR